MVDALVSVVLEQLSSIFIQEVQREVRLVVGVKSEVKKLASNFQAIQAVLADAEERQLKDQLVKHWLDQLKDVSYDMDDVLDEWGTAIAKSQSKVNEHPRKNTRKFVKMRGVKELSSLRELDHFHVSGSGEESNIGDLRNLNHLQGYLRIRWLGDVKDPDEVKKAELHNKKHLTGLGLRFDSRTDRRIIRDEEVLEALEPPPNIYTLRIDDYQGVILFRVFPGWINKLRVVRLVDWGKIENLPPLGKLPSLEELSIGEMGCVGRVGREFLGLGVDSDISIGEMTSSSSSNTIIAFPKLKSLSFFDMEEWEEWEGGNEDKTNISISTIIMPSLRSLEIRHCPKLKALPDYVLQSTTLEQLAIGGSSILEEQYLKAGGEGWPNASHTPVITKYGE